MPRADLFVTLAAMRHATTVRLPRFGERAGRRRLVLCAAAGCVVAAAIAVSVDRSVFSSGSPSRPELQQILDRLVVGRGRVAPGVTAFVSGPRGTWSGAAGLSIVKTGKAMWPNAPMHLDSQTKTWVATVILQLVGERRMRLSDTVERWLPGLLPYGKRITVRELLDHASGIVDQSTFDTNVLRFIQREIAGLIAAKAGGAPLGSLIAQGISRPLGLTSAAYVPGGEVGASHPQDYAVESDGTMRDATDWYRADEGASGAMIANARDDARFLTSLMRGQLLPPAELTAMRTPSAANPGYGLGIGIITTDCRLTAYEHGGASYSTTSAALVSSDGKRVAVVLLNGNISQGHSPGTRSSDAAFAAAKRCSAPHSAAATVLRACPAVMRRVGEGR